jgi:adenosylmethionine-8-amino-7-oxononanoate aminotransferase
VIARNMVDAIAFCPPLIAQISDIDTLVDRMGLALDLTLADIRAAR